LHKAIIAVCQNENLSCIPQTGAERPIQSERQLTWPLILGSAANAAVIVASFLAACFLASGPMG
jgi:hypothetical protein